MAGGWKGKGSLYAGKWGDDWLASGKERGRKPRAAGREMVRWPWGECGDLKWRGGGPWLSGYGRAKAKDLRGTTAVFQKISKVGGCDSFGLIGSTVALGERRRVFRVRVFVFFL
jgi:hypothetical protein